MAACIVIPVGVTKETVENILGGARGMALEIKCVIAVTVPGFEEVKEPIVKSLRLLADLLGASFSKLVIKPGDPYAARSLYKLIAEKEPSIVLFVGVTGSRYLYPVITMALLHYWREHRAEILLLHGVEGEEPVVVPLLGFFAPALRISSVQRRVLGIIYGNREPVSGKDLITRYGFTKSVYSVLEDLERKGLVRVRRGRIERTFPGELFYHLALTGSGEEKA